VLLLLLAMVEVIATCVVGCVLLLVLLLLVLLLLVLALLLVLNNDRVATTGFLERAKSEESCHIFELGVL
jgi:hypothetical protein